MMILSQYHIFELDTINIYSVDRNKILRHIMNDWIEFFSRTSVDFSFYPEPEFLNFYGAQESIPRNQFRQAV
jgi:hypothetical protein